MQNIMRLQDFLWGCMNRKPAGSAIHQELRRAGKDWNTITQLAPRTRKRGNVAWVCGCSCKNHGGKYELNLENARNVCYVQAFKILFSSDKFSPVVADSNPVFGQTVQLLLALWKWNTLQSLETSLTSFIPGLMDLIYAGLSISVLLPRTDGTLARFLSCS